MFRSASRMATQLSRVGIHHQHGQCALHKRPRVGRFSKCRPDIARSATIPTAEWRRRRHSDACCPTAGPHLRTSASHRRGAAIRKRRVARRDRDREAIAPVCKLRVDVGMQTHQDRLFWRGPWRRNRRPGGPIALPVGNGPNKCIKSKARQRSGCAVLGAFGNFRQLCVPRLCPSCCLMHGNFLPGVGTR